MAKYKVFGQHRLLMDRFMDVGRRQSFSIAAIVLGFMLVIAAAMSGTTMAIAFYKGIMVLHTVSDVRSSVVRFVFNFMTPLAGGIILVVAGITILQFEARTVERKVADEGRMKLAKARAHVISSLLSDDEKYVLGMVGSAPEGALQSDLVLKSNFSKVKMHRILKKLENKELIRRIRFGITNRVALVDR
jgi:uncharacterized membrane protein